MDPKKMTEEEYLQSLTDHVVRDQEDYGDEDQNDLMELIDSNEKDAPVAPVKHQSVKLPPDEPLPF